MFSRTSSKIDRKKLVACAAGALLLGAALLAASPARAQDNWPSRPIRLVVPFAAGGPSDATGRFLADGLARELKQSVVVDNKPGAGASIGAAAVAKAAPDGYTFLLGHAASVSATPQMRKVDYDPVKDLTPVAAVAGNFTLLVARKDFPAKNMAELKTLATSKPEAVTCATAGVGSGSHMACGTLAELLGAKLLLVHYKGSSEATVDQLAGRVDIFFDPSSLPHVKSGALKVLAARGKGGTRFGELATTPSFAEQGYPTMSDEIWIGLMAPAGTNPAIIKRMATAIERIANAPDSAEKLIRVSQFPQFIPTEDLRARISKDVPHYAALIQKLNLKVE
ncbi:MAG TPA: tripartite tricarboxylate transporter substrate binding protein [Ramlibacter sp.]|nr:tripartite tricarboxylate transporter substrate binding protein [Ramlibacter sp.]